MLLSGYVISTIDGQQKFEELNCSSVQFKINDLKNFFFAPNERI